MESQAIVSGDQIRAGKIFKNYITNGNGYICLQFADNVLAQQRLRRLRRQPGNRLQFEEVSLEHTNALGGVVRH